MLKSVLFAIVVSLGLIGYVGASELPASTITAFTALADSNGRMLFKTDMPSEQYVGANCPHDWFQLEGNTPQQVAATLMTAYYANQKVKFQIDDSQCSTGSWSKIVGVKVVRE